MTRFVTVEEHGNYSAFETETGEFGVRSAPTNQQYTAKSFAEARRIAQALAGEYEALNS